MTTESRLAPAALTLALTFTFATAPRPTAAQDAHAQHDHGAASAPASVVIDGVIRKVDVAAGKLTISHGDLPQLHMGPMTMAFRVKDAQWLQRYKPGDKVRFQYQRTTGGMIVTALEPAR